MIYRLRFTNDKHFLTWHDLHPEEEVDGGDKSVFYVIPQDARDARKRFLEWYINFGFVPPEVECVGCNVSGEIIFYRFL